MPSATLRLVDGAETGKVWIPSGRFARMRGLLGRDSLPRGELFLLAPCGAIHTFGMRFVIDVLFLDGDWRVIGVRKALRPGRLALGGLRARRTLEAAAGWLDLDRLQGARFLPPT